METSNNIVKTKQFSSLIFVKYNKVLHSEKQRFLFVERRTYFVTGGAI